MIIVYLSIAVIVGALIYLGVTAFKTFKDAKPALNKLQETAARLQAKTEGIKQETNKLTANQQMLVSDIEHKKKAFTQVVETAKQTPKPFIYIWKLALAKVKAPRRYTRARRLNPTK